MEHDKLSYVEALKWLAKRYNIEIEETELTPEQKVQQQTGDSLYIINSFAQQFFTNYLWEQEEGKTHALSYLKERGFRDEIIKKFQLGYNSQEKNLLATALIKQQFNKEIFPKTGLVVQRNDDEWSDNYRGRIIFPIHNNTGKIIGFGARIIGKNDKAPKYINTPENDIYSKSKVLYGSYFAKQAIDKANECLLVEGYTDVISLHQAGIENVVASGGTSLTQEQLRIIKKYTNNLTIIYDGDAAGVKAALRGLDMAVEEGLQVRLVLIPDNEDPDSYVNKIGTTAFNEFVKTNKKDFIIFKLEIMLKDAGNDIQLKNDAVNNIAETLSKLNRVEDFTKQQAYIKQCSQLLKIDEGGLIQLVNKYKRDKVEKELKKQTTNNADAVLPQYNETDVEQNFENNYVTNTDELHEKNVIRVLLEHGLKTWNANTLIASHIFEDLDAFAFDNPLLTKIYNTYKEKYYNNEQPTIKIFTHSEDKEIANLATSITMFPHELSSNWDNVVEGLNITTRDISLQDVNMSLNYFKLRKIKKMFDENQAELETAKTFEEQKTLIEVHKHLKEIEREITKQLGTVIFK
jgi:DNA primase